MNITTEITRKDLILFDVYAFPTLKSNWVSLIVTILGIGTYIAITKTPSDFIGYFILIFSPLVGGFAAISVALVFNTISMLLAVGKKSGVLGVHEFQLLTEGLRESSEANESLQRWNAIQSIQVHRGRIIIRINSFLFHVIPRRSFNNEELFIDFYK